MWKVIFYIGAIALVVLGLSSTVNAAGKIDVFVYTETVQWIGQPQAQAEADELMKLIKGKPGIGEVVNLGSKDIAAWTKAHTVKKGHHLIVLYGDIHPEIYPAGNAQKDGSIAEEFLDAGNSFANSADYFFWGLGGRNQEGGIQNMMDIPGIVQWDDNTAMKVTAEGKKLAPSLKDYATDRPFHIDQLVKPWEVEVALATETGDVNGARRCDPCIIHNTETDGRLIQVYQTADQVDPKGKVLAEIILNYYTEAVGVLAVQPEDKLSTTWGAIKLRR
jgi:hypothetical protein